MMHDAMTVVGQCKHPHYLADEMEIWWAAYYHKIQSKQNFTIIYSSRSWVGWLQWHAVAHYLCTLLIIKLLVHIPFCIFKKVRHFRFYILALRKFLSHKKRVPVFSSLILGCVVQFPLFLGCSVLVFPHSGVLIPLVLGCFLFSSPHFGVFYFVSLSSPHLSCE